MIPGVNDTLPSPTATTAKDKSKGTLSTDKDQFLKLLVAQLKYQDPMQPPDANKFTEQMTQYGQLEQLMNLNQSMGGLGAQQTLFERTQAVSYIGKTVNASGNEMSILQGSDIEPRYGFTLANNATNVNVTVRNDQGQTVRTMSLGPQAAGNTYNLFDKKDGTGGNLPNGKYSFTVEALDVNGNSIASSPLMQGVVTQVDFANDETILRMGSQDIPFGQVISVTL